MKAQDTAIIKALRQRFENLAEIFSEPQTPKPKQIFEKEGFKIICFKKPPKSSFPKKTQKEYDKMLDAQFSIEKDGQTVATFNHPLLARWLLEHIGEKTLKNFYDVINKNVPCPACGSKIGKRCMRGSEHEVWDKPHKARMKLFDKLLPSYKGCGEYWIKNWQKSPLFDYLKEENKPESR